MLQRQMSSEKPDRLSAVRSDEGLKDLLRIYLAEPDKAHPESETGPPDLRPALLGPYRDLETIRHDFPVVLVDGQCRHSHCLAGNHRRRDPG